jgi:hypothetical protein
MILDELAKTEGLMELFTEVEVQRIRYPAVDAILLRKRLLEITRESENTSFWHQAPGRMPSGGRVVGSRLGVDQWFRYRFGGTPSDSF